MFLDIKEENIISPALIASYEVNKLIKKRKEEGKPHLPIYLVGSYALKSILEETPGVECFGTGPDVIDDSSNVSFFKKIVQIISKKLSQDLNILNGKYLKKTSLQNWSLFLTLVFKKKYRDGFKNNLS